MLAQLNWGSCPNCLSSSCVGNDPIFNEISVRSLDRILGDWEGVDLVCEDCGTCWTLIVAGISDDE